MKYTSKIHWWTPRKSCVFRSCWTTTRFNCCIHFCKNGRNVWISPKWLAINIATSPKQQDSSENTNIHTLTQEVAKLSKTVSELVISKQSGQSNSLNQPSYSFSPQQNVQLTCYSCNFPGHKRKDCNYNDQFQPTPDKCQLCRHKGILRIDVKPNLTDDRETPKALATTGPIAKGTANISY